MPVGSVQPLRLRRDFAALRRHGRVGRHGPLTVRRAGGDAGSEPAVAYAVGRAVGTAVVRNRIRRRLRPLVAQCAHDGTLSGGRYLISATRQAADLPSPDLAHSLRVALERAGA